MAFKSESSEKNAWRQYGLVADRAGIATQIVIGGAGQKSASPQTTEKA